MTPSLESTASGSSFIDYYAPIYLLFDKQLVPALILHRAQEVWESKAELSDLLVALMRFHPAVHFGNAKLVALSKIADIQTSLPQFHRLRVSSQHEGSTL